MRQTSIILIFAAVTLCPPPARAQGVPEEVRAVMRDTAAAIRDSVAVLRTASYQQGREEQTDRQTKTVRIGTDGELTLANSAGDITVSRAKGGEATIEIVKTARARSAEEARELLGLVTVNVAERSGRADVKTIYPRGTDLPDRHRRNANVTVAYTVSAPAGTRLTIASVSGAISVADIKGDLSANSISGDVRIANGGRIASARSVSGGVEISDTDTDGAVEVQSVSGGVTLRKVKARRVEAGSVSGSVNVQDLQCDRVEAHSVSGNVEFGGMLAKGGRYELTSHSGNVRVAVAGNTGFEVEASSFSGSVRSDLALKLQGGERRGDGLPRHRTVQGVFGDGSAVLEVTTFSGNVVISRR